MAFTVTNSTIPVSIIQGDGTNGYWYLAIDENGEAYSGGYNSGTEKTVIAKVTIHGRNTFKQLMSAMIKNNVSLPQHDMSIDVESATERHALKDQFENPQLTNADVTAIFNAYDPVELCVKFGVFPLVRRGYLLGLITLPQLSQILIAMGQQDKITRQKAESAIDWLLNKNHINQSQYSNFWTLWDNKVGA